MHRWIQMTTKESKKYEGHVKDYINPGYGYLYIGEDPNIYSNAVVEMVEYQIDKFPIFQDILGTSGPKGKYGGWLSVRMNKGKQPVIYIG